MKVTLLQENFNKALLLVTKIVSSRIQLPILANVLLKAEKSTFSLATTDLETSFVIQVPAKIEKEGKITLPAKTLQELISSFPAEKVILIQEKEKLKITCGKISGEIRGMSAEEFPSMPSVKNKAKGWKIEGADFIEACTQVVFSASFDEARPALSGVRCELIKGGLELVATDGYRLSRKTLKGKFLKEKVLIIPAKALLEVSRISLGDKNSLLVFPERKENQVIFLFDNAQIATRLIEGEYPPFAKIIPQSWKTQLVINREELIKALKTAAVFARESANIIKLKSASGRIKISANAPQLGENETELEAKIKGEETEIAFNFRFVLDFLNSIDGEEVSLKLNGGLAPVVFEQVGDPSLLHIIMPVRVQKPED